MSSRNRLKTSKTLGFARGGRKILNVKNRTKSGDSGANLRVFSASFFMPIFEETGSRFPEFTGNLAPKTVCYTL